jgi:hypothetical protein
MPAKAKVEKSRLANEAETAMWQRRIERSLAVAAPRHRVFTRNEAWYAGFQNLEFDDLGVPAVEGMFTYGYDPGPHGQIIVNRLMAIVAAQVASIAYKDPWARLKTRKPLGDDRIEKTRVAEYTLNYVLRAEENDLQQQIRTFVVNCLMAYGILKVSYTPEFATPAEEDERTGPLEFDQDTGDFDILGGIPALSDDKSSLVSRGDEFLLESFLPGQLFQVRSVQWQDVAHDPEGGQNFYDHAWFAERMVFRLDEFEDDPLYNHKKGIDKAAKHIDDVLSEGPNRIHNMTHRYNYRAAGGGASDPTDEDGLRLFAWQIHDFKTGDEMRPQWVRHSPYVFGMFHRRPGEWFPITETEAWIPTGETYNQLNWLKLRHTKRFLRKYQVQEDELDESGFDQLKDHEDGVILKTKSGGEVVFPIKDAPMDPTIYNDMGRAITDGNEIMASPNETARTDTATVGAIVESRAVARETDKKSVVARALSRAFQKMLSNLQANLDTKLAVAIAGPDGEVWEQQVGRIQLTGEWDVEIDINEMGLPNSDKRVAKLNQAISLFGPVVFRSKLFVRRYLQELEMDDPALADDIVAQFQQVQSEALIQQEMRQGGFRGVGGQEPGQGQGGGMAVVQGGGGPSGGRSAGRNARSRP